MGPFVHHNGRVADQLGALANSGVTDLGFYPAPADLQSLIQEMFDASGTTSNAHAHTGGAFISWDTDQDGHVYIATLAAPIIAPSTAA